MVNLNDVTAANSALARKQPLVAVFVGGTAGIGEYTVRALAQHAAEGPGLRVYLVGRNMNAAERLIAEFRAKCPAGEFQFVNADDLSLLKDVDRVSAEIIKLEREKKDNPRIDILVMSQGWLGFERHDTAKGLDEHMSLYYYGRMRFINNLMPLLEASNLPAHCVSIFTAGKEGKLVTDDLSLRKPGNSGVVALRSQVAFMTQLYMEELAKQHPGKLALVNYFPGLVMTDAVANGKMPVWLRFLWFSLLQYVASLFAVPRDESGERVLFLASSRYPARQAGTLEGSLAKEEVAAGSNGVLGGGAYSCGWNGEVNDVEKVYREHRHGSAKLVWDHTEKAFSEIKAGRVFTD